LPVCIYSSDSVSRSAYVKIKAGMRREIFLVDSATLLDHAAAVVTDTSGLDRADEATFAVSRGANVQWNGRAWDANGRPIERSGNLLSNPNTQGRGGGDGHYGGSGLGYSLRGEGQCVTWTEISINHTVVILSPGWISC
jgi:hypothetical protein